MQAYRKRSAALKVAAAREQGQPSHPELLARSPTDTRRTQGKAKQEEIKAHATDALTLELLEQAFPTRVNIPRREAGLGVKAHVRDVAEAGRRSDHALVDAGRLALLAPAAAPAASSKRRREFARR